MPHYGVFIQQAQKSKYTSALCPDPSIMPSMFMILPHDARMDR